MIPEAHCAEQFGIERVKIPFDLNIISWQKGEKKTRV